MSRKVQKWVDFPVYKGRKKVERQIFLCTLYKERVQGERIDLFQKAIIVMAVIGKAGMVDFLGKKVYNFIIYKKDTRGKI